jgi:hypothetical protein
MSKVQGPGESKSTLHAASHKSKVSKQQQQLAEKVGDKAESVLSSLPKAHPKSLHHDRVKDKTHSG